MNNKCVGKRLLCVCCVSFACSVRGLEAADESRLPDISSVNVVQQTKTVTCVVVDELGPVVGANVVVKGTTNRTITDMNGNAVL